MREAEGFWEELLAQIEVGQVIPVIGPGLFTVVENGREAPLYRVLAERLLTKYRLTAVEPEADSAPEPTAVLLRPGHELNDSVCALVQSGRRVQDLYRPIHDLLKALLETPAESSLQPLKQLAGIAGFRLFVTTTPNDSLARAIDAERHEGHAQTDSIIFAPKLVGGILGDLPEMRTSGYTTVSYL